MTKRPAIDAEERIDNAHARRNSMAAASTDKTAYPPLVVLSNGDNDLSCRPMAFAKGLAHDETGKVASGDIDALRTALCGRSGAAEADPAFDVPHASTKGFVPAYQHVDPNKRGFRKFESDGVCRISYR